MTQDTGSDAPGTAADADSVEQRLSALEASVTEWGEIVRTALADLGTAVGAALSGLAESVSAQPAPAAADVPATDANALETEMLALRGDLADALDETREQLLAAQERALAELRDDLGGRIDGLASS
jgi:hypothetical protein